MILECNRLSSEEGKTSNNSQPAIFTNKLGSGIKLNSGDTISVHSSFISELGAGVETIQFNGRTITDNLGNALTNTISYINVSQTNACYLDPIPDENDFNAVKYGIPLLINASTVTETITLKDNETTMVVGYYKTRNGECCVALPRRYISASGVSNASTGKSEEWELEDSVDNGLPYSGISEVNGGVLNVDAREPGGIINDYNRSYFVEDDYIYKKGSLTISASNASSSYYKLNTDNSKHKIFINTNTTGTKLAGFITGNGTNASMNWYPYSSPSQSHYEEYLEKLTLTCPIGFSSPNAIAETITDQLRRSSEPEKTNLYEWNEVIANERQRIQVHVSTTTPTPTYKPFRSMSVSCHNASTYNSFYNACFGGIGPTSASNTRWMYNQYISSYQHIGIKRPDWYKHGQLLANSMEDFAYGTFNKFCRLLYDVNASVSPDKYNASIVITHEWTDDNLLLWKNWLETQGNYPELFTNKTNNYESITTKDNSRYLHLNINMFQGRLGGDNVDTTTLNASSQNSVPLFFDYQPEFKDELNDGGDPTRLCYGFAFKTYAPQDTKSYITFRTSGLGNMDTTGFNGCQTTLGIPYEYAYYSGNSGSGRTAGIITGVYKDNTDLIGNIGNDARRCGFDKHFNSFGNSVIGLSDGYLKKTFGNSGYYGVNTQEANHVISAGAVIDATPFAEKIILGSQEPQLEYNSLNGKFNLSQLHTPEYIGNLWNAGILSTVSACNTTENPEAQNKVYKINKRLQNTNFTSDMIPYSLNYASGMISTETASGTITLSLMNTNISPWTIFDAHSGIIIDNFGQTEVSWNKSLWKTLGFNYDQFHAPITSSNNINTRVTEVNKDIMPFGMTNADIKGGDTINYNTNLFGAPLMTSQIPLPILLGGKIHDTPPFVANRFPNAYPTIVEAQTSITLEAINLPTKMSRAYYSIRSDLLDSYTSLGSTDSGQPLKVIGIVNKQNADGDFYFQADNPLKFTITNPKTITEIRTSIHDPDGRLSNVSLDSAVIYRIDKNINSSLSVIDELIGKTNKK